MHVLVDSTSEIARLPGMVSSSIVNLSHQYHHCIIHHTSISTCTESAGSSYWRYHCYCNAEVSCIAGCSSTPMSAGITHLTPQYRMIPHAMAMTMPVTLPPLTSTWPVFICIQQLPHIGHKLCSSRSVVLEALSCSSLAARAMYEDAVAAAVHITCCTCLQYAKQLS